MIHIYNGIQFETSDNATLEEKQQQYLKVKNNSKPCKRCSNCGYANDEDATSCSICGCTDLYDSTTGSFHLKGELKK